MDVYECQHDHTVTSNWTKVGGQKSAPIKMPQKSTVTIKDFLETRNLESKK